MPMDDMAVGHARRRRHRANLGIIKFLGYAQIFKNALTGMPIGGGRGGSYFDPEGRSDGAEQRLAAIMRGIHDRCMEAADEYGSPGNYLAGANIAGFTQVADAMVALGVICQNPLDKRAPPGRH